jgi:hypothetical protein
LRAQSKRGGERVRLRAQVSGGKWASGARGSKGARTCGDGRRTRGRGGIHDEGRGREVGDGLTDGLRRTEGESGCAGARKGADRTSPLCSGRERGSARADAYWRDPPVRHRGHAGAGARARLGLLGRLG